MGWKKYTGRNRKGVELRCQSNSSQNTKTVRGEKKSWFSPLNRT
jgi:hypothetical protein